MMRTKANSATAYATSENFRRVFTEDLNALYQLAFLLTRLHLAEPIM